MTDIDRLKPELRALIHEYGWIIVRDSYDGGLIDNLSWDLETWREREQERLYPGTVSSAPRTELV